MQGDDNSTRPLVDQQNKTMESYSTNITPGNKLTQDSSITSALSKVHHNMNTSETVLRLSPVDINLHTKTNKEEHATHYYDIPGLVLRRGQTFTFTIRFNRDYIPNEYNLSVIFKSQTWPNLPNVKIPLNGSSHGWSTKQVTTDSNENNHVHIQICSPSNAVIGKYIFLLEICPTTKDPIPNQGLSIFQVDFDLYLLFNPWNKSDTCALLSNEQIAEYVMNEQGQIYLGSSEMPQIIPWYFGQFERVVLLAALALLSKTNLSAQHRIDSLLILRILSSKICSDPGTHNGVFPSIFDIQSTKHIENGYTSSSAILNEYMNMNDASIQKHSGTNWQHAVVFCSLCRSLGIPCRLVTIYNGTCGTCEQENINVHWSTTQKSTVVVNSKLTRPWYLWNECCIRRDDLPTEYSGWQVVDSSFIDYDTKTKHTGPCSVLGLKAGLFNFPWDTPNIHGLLSGDRVYWLVHPNGHENLINVEENVIGTKIITKSLKADLMYDDITNNYKSMRKRNHEPIWHHDVNIDIDIPDSIKFGEDLQMTLKVKNQSSEHRTMTIALKLVKINPIDEIKLQSKQQHPTASTGQRVQSDIKSISSQTEVQTLIQIFDLDKNEHKSIPIRIAEHSEIWTGCFDSLLKLHVHVLIRETGQIYQREKYIVNAEDGIFELSLDKNVIEIGQPVTLRIVLNKPLSYTLSNGYISIDGFGVSQCLSIGREQLAGERTLVPVEVVPQRVGIGKLYVNLRSSTLCPTPKSTVIHVHAPDRIKCDSFDVEGDLAPQPSNNSYEGQIEHRPILLPEPARIVDIPLYREAQVKIDNTDENKEKSNNLCVMMDEPTQKTSTLNSEQKFEHKLQSKQRTPIENSNVECNQPKSISDDQSTSKETVTANDINDTIQFPSPSPTITQNDISPPLTKESDPGGCNERFILPKTDEEYPQKQEIRKTPDIKEINTEIFLNSKIMLPSTPTQTIDNQNINQTTAILQTPNDNQSLAIPGTNYESSSIDRFPNERSDKEANEYKVLMKETPGENISTVPMVSPTLLKSTLLSADDKENSLFDTVKCKTEPIKSKSQPTQMNETPLEDRITKEAIPQRSLAPTSNTTIEVLSKETTAKQTDNTTIQQMTPVSAITTTEHMINPNEQPLLVTPIAPETSPTTTNLLDKTFSEQMEPMEQFKNKSYQQQESEQINESNQSDISTPTTNQPDVMTDNTAADSTQLHKHHSDKDHTKLQETDQINVVDPQISLSRDQPTQDRFDNTNTELSTPEQIKQTHSNPSNQNHTEISDPTMLLSPYNETVLAELKDTSAMLSPVESIKDYGPQQEFNTTQPLLHPTEDTKEKPTTYAIPSENGNDEDTIKIPLVPNASVIPVIEEKTTSPQSFSKPYGTEPQPIDERPSLSIAQTLLPTVRTNALTQKEPAILQTICSTDQESPNIETNTSKTHIGKDKYKPNSKTHDSTTKLQQNSNTLPSQPPSQITEPKLHPIEDPSTEQLNPEFTDNTAHFQTVKDVAVAPLPESPFATEEPNQNEVYPTIIDTKPHAQLSEATHVYSPDIEVKANTESLPKLDSAPGAVLPLDAIVGTPSTAVPATNVNIQPHIPILPSAVDAIVPAQTDLAGPAVDTKPEATKPVQQVPLLVDESTVLDTSIVDSQTTTKPDVQYNAPVPVIIAEAVLANAFLAVPNTFTNVASNTVLLPSTAESVLPVEPDSISPSLESKPEETRNVEQVPQLVEDPMLVDATLIDSQKTSDQTVQSTTPSPNVIVEPAGATPSLAATGTITDVKPTVVLLPSARDVVVAMATDSAAPPQEIISQEMKPVEEPPQPVQDAIPHHATVVDSQKTSADDVQPSAPAAIVIVEPSEAMASVSAPDMIPDHTRTPVLLVSTSDVVLAIPTDTAAPLQEIISEPMTPIDEPPQLVEDSTPLDGSVVDSQKTIEEVVQSSAPGSVVIVESAEATPAFPVPDMIADVTPTVLILPAAADIVVPVGTDSAAPAQEIIFQDMKPVEEPPQLVEDSTRLDGSVVDSQKTSEEDAQCSAPRSVLIVESAEATPSVPVPDMIADVTSRVLILPSAVDIVVPLGTDSAAPTQEIMLQDMKPVEEPPQLVEDSTRLDGSVVDSQKTSEEDAQCSGPAAVIIVESAELTPAVPVPDMIADVTPTLLILSSAADIVVPVGTDSAAPTQEIIFQDMKPVEEPPQLVEDSTPLDGSVVDSQKTSEEDAQCSAPRSVLIVESAEATPAVPVPDMIADVTPTVLTLPSAADIVVPVGTDSAAPTQEIIFQDMKPVEEPPQLDEDFTPLDGSVVDSQKTSEEDAQCSAPRSVLIVESAEATPAVPVPDMIADVTPTVLILPSAADIVVPVGTDSAAPTQEIMLQDMKPVEEPPQLDEDFTPLDGSVVDSQKTSEEVAQCSGPAAVIIVESAELTPAVPVPDMIADVTPTVLTLPSAADIVVPVGTDSAAPTQEIIFQDMKPVEEPPQLDEDFTPLDGSVVDSQKTSEEDAQCSAPRSVLIVESAEATPAVPVPDIIADVTPTVLTLPSAADIVVPVGTDSAAPTQEIIFQDMKPVEEPPQLDEDFTPLDGSVVDSQKTSEEDAQCSAPRSVLIVESAEATPAVPVPDMIADVTPTVLTLPSAADIVVPVGTDSAAPTQEIIFQDMKPVEEPPQLDEDFTPLDGSVVDSKKTREEAAQCSGPAAVIIVESAELTPAVPVPDMIADVTPTLLILSSAADIVVPVGTDSAAPTQEIIFQDMKPVEEPPQLVEDSTPLDGSVVDSQKTSEEDAQCSAPRSVLIVESAEATPAVPVPDMIADVTPTVLTLPSAADIVVPVGTDSAAPTQEIIFQDMKPVEEPPQLDEDFTPLDGSVVDSQKTSEEDAQCSAPRSVLIVESAELTPAVPVPDTIADVTPTVLILPSAADIGVPVGTDSAAPTQEIIFQDMKPVEEPPQLDEDSTPLDGSVVDSQKTREEVAQCSGPAAVIIVESAELTPAVPVPDTIADVTPTVLILPSAADIGVPVGTDSAAPTQEIIFQDMKPVEEPPQLDQDSTPLDGSVVDSQKTREEVAQCSGPAAVIIVESAELTPAVPVPDTIADVTPTVLILPSAADIVVPVGTDSAAPTQEIIFQDMKPVEEPPQLDEDSTPLDGSVVDSRKTSDEVAQCSAPAAFVIVESAEATPAVPVPDTIADVTPTVLILPSAADILVPVGTDSAAPAQEIILEDMKPVEEPPQLVQDSTPLDGSVVDSQKTSQEGVLCSGPAAVVIVESAEATPTVPVPDMIADVTPTVVILPSAADILVPVGTDSAAPAQEIMLEEMKPVEEPPQLVQDSTPLDGSVVDSQKTIEEVVQSSAPGSVVIAECAEATPSVPVPDMIAGVTPTLVILPSAADIVVPVGTDSAAPPQEIIFEDLKPVEKPNQLAQESTPLDGSVVDSQKTIEEVVQSSAPGSVVIVESAEATPAFPVPDMITDVTPTVVILRSAADIVVPIGTDSAAPAQEIILEDMKPVEEPPQLVQDSTPLDGSVVDSQKTSQEGALCSARGSVVIVESAEATPAVPVPDMIADVTPTVVILPSAADIVVPVGTDSAAPAQEIMLEEMKPVEEPPQLVQDSTPLDGSVVDSQKTSQEGVLCSGPAAVVILESAEATPAVPVLDMIADVTPTVVILPSAADTVVPVGTDSAAPAQEIILEDMKPVEEPPQLVQDSTPLDGSVVDSQKTIEEVVQSSARGSVVIVESAEAAPAVPVPDMITDVTPTVVILPSAADILVPVGTDSAAPAQEIMLEEMKPVEEPPQLVQDSTPLDGCVADSQKTSQEGVQSSAPGSVVIVESAEATPVVPVADMIADVTPTVVILPSAADIVVPVGTDSAAPTHEIMLEEMKPVEEPPQLVQDSTPLDGSVVDSQKTSQEGVLCSGPAAVVILESAEATPAVPVLDMIADVTPTVVILPFAADVLVPVGTDSAAPAQEIMLEEMKPVEEPQQLLEDSTPLDGSVVDSHKTSQQGVLCSGPAGVVIVESAEATPSVPVPDMITDVTPTVVILGSAPDIVVPVGTDSAAPAQETMLEEMKPVEEPPQLVEDSTPLDGSVVDSHKTSQQGVLCSGPAGVVIVESAEATPSVPVPDMITDVTPTVVILGSAPDIVVPVGTDSAAPAQEIILEDMKPVEEPPQLVEDSTPLDGSVVDSQKTSQEGVLCSGPAAVVILESAEATPAVPVPDMITDVTPTVGILRSSADIVVPVGTDSAAPAQEIILEDMKPVEEPPQLVQDSTPLDGSVVDSQKTIEEVVQSSARGSVVIVESAEATPAVPVPDMITDVTPTVVILPSAADILVPVGTDSAAPAQEIMLEEMKPVEEPQQLVEDSTPLDGSVVDSHKTSQQGVLCSGPAGVVIVESAEATPSVPVPDMITDVTPTVVILGSAPDIVVPVGTDSAAPAQEIMLEEMKPVEEPQQLVEDSTPLDGSVVDSHKTSQQGVLCSGPAGVVIVESAEATPSVPVPDMITDVTPTVVILGSAPDIVVPVGTDSAAPAQETMLEEMKPVEEPPQLVEDSTPLDGSVVDSQKTSQEGVLCSGPAAVVILESAEATPAVPVPDMITDVTPTVGILRSSADIVVPVGTDSAAPAQEIILEDMKPVEEPPQLVQDSTPLDGSVVDSQKTIEEVVQSSARGSVVIVESAEATPAVPVPDMITDVTPTVVILPSAADILVPVGTDSAAPAQEIMLEEMKPVEEPQQLVEDSTPLDGSVVDSHKTSQQGVLCSGPAGVVIVESAEATPSVPVPDMITDVTPTVVILGSAPDIVVPVGTDSAAPAQEIILEDMKPVEEPPQLVEDSTPLDGSVVDCHKTSQQGVLCSGPAGVVIVESAEATPSVPVPDMITDVTPTVVVLGSAPDIVVPVGTDSAAPAQEIMLEEMKPVEEPPQLVEDSTPLDGSVVDSQKTSQEGVLCSGPAAVVILESAEATPAVPVPDMITDVTPTVGILRSSADIVVPVGTDSAAPAQEIILEDMKPVEEPPQLVQDSTPLDGSVVDSQKTSQEGVQCSGPAAVVIVESAEATPTVPVPDMITDVTPTVGILRSAPEIVVPIGTVSAAPPDEIILEEMKPVEEPPQLVEHSTPLDGCVVDSQKTSQEVAQCSGPAGVVIVESAEATPSVPVPDMITDVTPTVLILPSAADIVVPVGTDSAAPAQEIILEDMKPVEEPPQLVEHSTPLDGCVVDSQKTSQEVAQCSGPAGVVIVESAEATPSVPVPDMITDVTPTVVILPSAADIVVPVGTDSAAPAQEIILEDMKPVEEPPQLVQDSTPLDGSVVDSQKTSQEGVQSSAPGSVVIVESAEATPAVPVPDMIADVTPTVVILPSAADIVVPVGTDSAAPAQEIMLEEMKPVEEPPQLVQDSTPLDGSVVDSQKTSQEGVQCSVPGSVVIVESAEATAAVPVPDMIADVTPKVVILPSAPDIVVPIGTDSAAAAQEIIFEAIKPVEEPPQLVQDSTPLYGSVVDSQKTSDDDAQSRAPAAVVIRGPSEASPSLPVPDMIADVTRTVVLLGSAGDVVLAMATDSLTPPPEIIREEITPVEVPPHLVQQCTLVDATVVDCRKTTEEVLQFIAPLAIVDVGGVVASGLPSVCDTTGDVRGSMRLLGSDNNIDVGLVAGPVSYAAGIVPLDVELGAVESEGYDHISENSQHSGTVDLKGIDCDVGSQVGSPSCLCKPVLVDGVAVIPPLGLVEGSGVEVPSVFVVSAPVENGVALSPAESGFSVELFSGNSGSILTGTATTADVSLEKTTESISDTNVPTSALTSNIESVQTLPSIYCSTADSLESATLLEDQTGAVDLHRIVQEILDTIDAIVESEKIALPELVESVPHEINGYSSLEKISLDATTPVLVTVNEPMIEESEETTTNSVVGAPNLVPEIATSNASNDAPVLTETLLESTKVCGDASRTNFEPIHDLEILQTSEHIISPEKPTTSVIIGSMHQPVNVEGTLEPIFPMTSMVATLIAIDSEEQPSRLSDSEVKEDSAVVSPEGMTLGISGEVNALAVAAVNIKDNFDENFEISTIEGADKKIVNAIVVETQPENQDLLVPVETTAELKKADLLQENSVSALTTSLAVTEDEETKEISKQNQMDMLGTDIKLAPMSEDLLESEKSVPSTEVTIGILRNVDNEMNSLQHKEMQEGLEAHPHRLMEERDSLLPLANSTIQETDQDDATKSIGLTDTVEDGKISIDNTKDSAKLSGLKGDESIMKIVSEHEQALPCAASTLLFDAHSETDQATMIMEAPVAEVEGLCEANTSSASKLSHEHMSKSTCDEVGEVDKPNLALLQTNLIKANADEDSPLPIVIGDLSKVSEKSPTGQVTVIPIIDNTTSNTIPTLEKTFEEKKINDTTFNAVVDTKAERQNETAALGIVGEMQTSDKTEVLSSVTLPNEVVEAITIVQIAPYVDLTPKKFTYSEDTSRVIIIGEESKNENAETTTVTMQSPEINNIQGLPVMQEVPKVVVIDVTSNNEKSIVEQTEMSATTPEMMNVNDTTATVLVPVLPSGNIDVLSIVETVPLEPLSSETLVSAINTDNSNSGNKTNKQCVEVQGISIGCESEILTETNETTIAEKEKNIVEVQETTVDTSIIDVKPTLSEVTTMVTASMPACTSERSLITVKDVYGAGITDDLSCLLDEDTQLVKKIDNAACSLKVDSASMVESGCSGVYSDVGWSDTSAGLAEMPGNSFLERSEQRETSVNDLDHEMVLDGSEKEMVPGIDSTIGKNDASSMLVWKEKVESVGTFAQGSDECLSPKNASCFSHIDHGLEDRLLLDIDDLCSEEKQSSTHNVECESVSSSSDGLPCIIDDSNELNNDDQLDKFDSMGGMDLEKGAIEMLIKSSSSRSGDTKNEPLVLEVSNVSADDQPNILDEDVATRSFEDNTTTGNNAPSNPCSAEQLTSIVDEISASRSMSSCNDDGQRSTNATKDVTPFEEKEHGA